MNPEIGRKLLERMGWSRGQGLGKNNEGSLQPLACELVEKQDRRGLESSLDHSPLPTALPIVVLPDGLPPPRPAPPVIADAARRVFPTMRAGAGLTTPLTAYATGNRDTANTAAAPTPATPVAIDFTSDRVDSVSIIASAGADFLISRTKSHTGALATPPSAAPNPFRAHTASVLSSSAGGGGLDCRDAGAAAAAAAASGAPAVVNKHPVSLLFELAAKNYWAPPDMTCEEQVLGYDLSGSQARKQFRVLVHLNGRTHTGSWELQKKKARTTAAISALTELGLVASGTVFALASAAEDFA